MRTAILGAVAGLGLTAGAASAHPPAYGYGWGGYRPVVVRPAPVVVAQPGISVGFGFGNFSGVYSSGGFYRPSYGYGGWGGYGRGYGYSGYGRGYGYPGWGGGYGGYRPYGGYRGW